MESEPQHRTVPHPPPASGHMSCLQRADSTQQAEHSSLAGPDVSVERSPGLQEFHTGSRDFKQTTTKLDAL